MVTRWLRPNFKTNEEPLEYVTKACEAAGYKPGVDIMFAMDPASTEFYDAIRRSTCWRARAAS